MEKQSGVITETRYAIAYMACLVFFLAEAIMGIVQLTSTGFSYACGSFINSGPYSCFLAVILPIIIRLYQLSKIPVVRLLCITAIFLACILIPFQLSRTALVAGIAGIAFVFGLQFINSKNAATRVLIRWTVILSSIAVLILLFIGIVLQIKANSASGRLMIWKIVLKYIDRDILISGTGWDSVSTIYAEFQERYFSSGEASSFEEYLADTPNYLFNEYLQCLIAFGIIGLLVSVGIIVYIFIQSKKHNIIGIQGATIAFSIVMFFSYPLHCWEYWCLAIILGVNAALLQKSNFRRIIISLASIFCAYCGIYNYFIPQKIELNFNVALALHTNENFEYSNQILKAYVEHKSPAVIVLYLLAQNYYKQGDAEHAKYYYHKAATRVPNKIYPHYKLMQIHIEENDMVNARKEAAIIVNRNPKVKSPATEEMKKNAADFINNISVALN